MLTGIAARPENPGIDIPVYGVPVNTREALGVLHFKGFIIDDSVLYSGASLNDVYLHQLDKYRYDRYHLIRNPQMADIMFNWVDKTRFMVGVCTVLTILIARKARKSKRRSLLPPGTARCGLSFSG